MKSLLPLLLSLIALQQFANSWCNAQECNFLTLSNSLIWDDENVYRLSRAFFPPVANAPEFVNVTYTFTETAETQTWYWSASTSSFIHPPEVLQFMSLFFTKAHNFFKGDVQLTLSPVNETSISDCAQDLEKMQLLTQRLQLYAMRQTRTVIIDTSYTAKAFIAPITDKHTKFNKVAFDTVSPKSFNVLVILSLLAIILLSIAIIASVICLFCSSQQDHWQEKMDKQKPLICSIALVSMAVTLYNFTLSILAVDRYRAHYTSHPLYTSNAEITIGPVAILLFFDFLFCLGACIVIVIVVCYVKCCKSNGDTESPPWYVILSFTIFCPIISVMAHSPYIIIGYLNDGDHANSIFIYYTVVIGIGYAICWVGFHPHKFVQPTSTKHKNRKKDTDPESAQPQQPKSTEHENGKKDTDPENAQPQQPKSTEHENGKKDSEPENEQQKRTKCERAKDNKFTIIASVGFCSVIVAYILIVITITMYFVAIPINKSVSDTPDRLAGIYQSGGFIIVSFVLYKMIAFFYKSRQKTGLERAITERAKSLKITSHKDWETKKEYEKVHELYDVLVDIISDGHRNRAVNNRRNMMLLPY